MEYAPGAGGNERVEMGKERMRSGDGLGIVLLKIGEGVGMEWAGLGWVGWGSVDETKRIGVFENGRNDGSVCGISFFA